MPTYRVRYKQGHSAIGYVHELSVLEALAMGQRMTARPPEDAVTVEIVVFKRYTALDGEREAPIITVSAESEQEAHERIVEELGKNPSRQWYLERWIVTGCRIVVQA